MGTIYGPSFNNYKCFISVYSRAHPGRSVNFKQAPTFTVSFLSIDLRFSRKLSAAISGPVISKPYLVFINRRSSPGVGMKSTNIFRKDLRATASMIGFCCNDYDSRACSHLVRRTSLCLIRLIGLLFIRSALMLCSSSNPSHSEMFSKGSNGTLIAIEP